MSAARTGSEAAGVRRDSAVEDRGATGTGNPLMGPHLLSEGATSTNVSRVNSLSKSPGATGASVTATAAPAPVVQSPDDPDHHRSRSVAAQSIIGHSVIEPLPSAHNGAGEEREISAFETEGDDDDDEEYEDEGDLYELSPEEQLLRDKVHDVLAKFDVSRLGVLSTVEAERILLQLGMKPADVSRLSGPTQDIELTALSHYLDGPARLSSYGRRDRTIVDIAVLTERVACMIEGTTMLAKAGVSESEPSTLKSPSLPQPPPPPALDDEGKPLPPKRRGSVERVFDKYVHISADDIHSVGAVKSILDARLKLIVRQWRRAYCDNGVRRCWDLLHLFTILFVFVTTTWYNYRWIEREPLFLWSINVGCHIIWILDIAASVILFARSPSTQKLISNYKEIVMARRTQLVLDAAAALPVDLILWWFVADYHRNNEPTAPIFVAFLCLRGVKLLKIARIMTLFEIVNTDVLDAGAVTFYYQLRPIIRGFALSVTTLHVLVCLVHVAHAKYSSYLEALMFTMSMLFGAGPSVLWDTTMDYVMMLILMPISVILRGIVIGKISVFLFEGDVASQNLVVMQDTLALLRHYDCPPELQQEILSFQRHLVSDDISHHLSVLGDLPDDMQSEMQTCMKMTALQTIPFLQDVGSDVRIDLANAMTRYNADPLEVLIELHDLQDRAFIVVHGSVDILGPTNALIRTVDAPGFVGETALLGADDVPARYTARAVSYADLWVITRESFHRVLTSHVSVGMSIEGYYGEDHAFVQHLEAVLGGYCQGIEDALEEAAEEDTKRSISRYSSKKSLHTSVREQHSRSSSQPSVAAGSVGAPRSPGRRGSAASGSSSAAGGPGRGVPSRGRSTVARRWLTVFRSVRNMSETREDQPTAITVTNGNDDSLHAPAAEASRRRSASRSGRPLDLSASAIDPAGPSRSTSSRPAPSPAMSRHSSRFAVLARAVVAAPRAAKDRMLAKQASAASFRGGDRHGVDQASDGPAQQSPRPLEGSHQLHPRAVVFSTTDVRRSSASRRSTGGAAVPAIAAAPSGTFSNTSQQTVSDAGAPAPALDLNSSGRHQHATPRGGRVVAVSEPPTPRQAEYVRSLEARLETAEKEMAQMNGLVAKLIDALKKHQGGASLCTRCQQNEPPPVVQRRTTAAEGRHLSTGPPALNQTAMNIERSSSLPGRSAEVGEGQPGLVRPAKGSQIVEFQDGEQRRQSLLCESTEDWYTDNDDDAAADSGGGDGQSAPPARHRKPPPHPQHGQRAPRSRSSVAALRRDPTAASPLTINRGESGTSTVADSDNVLKADFHDLMSEDDAEACETPSSSPKAVRNEARSVRDASARQSPSSAPPTPSGTLCPPEDKRAASGLSSPHQQAAQSGEGRSAETSASAHASFSKSSRNDSAAAREPTAAATRAVSQEKSPHSAASPSPKRADSGHASPAGHGKRQPRAAQAQAADATPAPSAAAATPQPRRSTSRPRSAVTRQNRSPEQRNNDSVKHRPERPARSAGRQRPISGADVFRPERARQGPPPKQPSDSWTDDEICID